MPPVLAEVAEFIEEGVTALKGLADAAGFERASSVLESVDLGVKSYETLATENPLEADIIFAATLVAGSILGPRILPAAAAISEAYLVRVIASEISVYFADEAAGAASMTAVKAIVAGALSAILDKSVKGSVDDVFIAAQKIDSFFGVAGATNFPHVSESEDGSFRSVTLENQDGSSVNTVYSQDGGALTLVLRDFEKTDGTSVITNFHRNGSSSVYVYSEPSGQGDIIAEYNIRSKYSGFNGQRVGVAAYSPDQTSSNILAYGSAIVGDQVEFTSENTISTGYTPPNSHLSLGSTDISNNEIYIYFDPADAGKHFTSGPFNGGVVRSLDPGAPGIKSVSLLDTNIAGFTDANIAFSNHSISTNFAGLYHPTEGAGFVDIGVTFYGRNNV